MAYKNGSSLSGTKPRVAPVSFNAVSILLQPVQRFTIHTGIVTQDLRHDYGEDRFSAIGAINDLVYVLVYTMRGTVIRIISARKANAREVKHYEHHARQIRSNRP